MEKKYYFLPDLTNRLIGLAEKEMPRFSGQTRVLKAVIEFTYGEDDPKQLIVMFWRPNNSMMVGYSVINNDHDANQFQITANHSSAWRYDGFDFYHHALPQPRAWKLIGHEIIEAEVLEAGNFAFLEPKPVVSQEIISA